MKVQKNQRSRPKAANHTSGETGSAETRRFLAVLLALSFVLAIGLGMSACSKQGVARNGADPVGEYALVSVDGKPVPADLSHQGVSLKVISGTFIIKADGTISSKTVFVPPTGTEVEREVAATYTREGSKLTMKWQGAGITVGNLQDDTFTMDNEGMEFVYRR